MRFNLYSALFLLLFVIAPNGATANEVTTCPSPGSIDSSVRLSNNCRYSGPIEITASNVTLDCAGATIDAINAKVGILVTGKATNNVTIKDCVVTGAVNDGILVRPPMSARELAELPMEDRYDISSKNIIISGVTVTNSGNVGIYIGHYAQDVLITDAHVYGSGSPAIYLDASSVRTTIENSEFVSNGFGDPLGRKKPQKKREAIAVDSSSYNRIVNNKFVGNGFGGIFLYKNCWERHESPNQAPRWMHSSFNVIDGNHFEERIGVWVASRQARKLNMGCGDPAISPGYYRDYAEKNTISNNTFVGGDVGINVQDDYTNILNNKFFSQKQSCVILGSALRDTLLKETMESSVLIGNLCKTKSSTPFGVGGNSTYSRCEGNVVNAEDRGCPVSELQE